MAVALPTSVAYSLTDVGVLVAEVDEVARRGVEVGAAVLAAPTPRAEEAEPTE